MKRILLSLGVALSPAGLGATPLGLALAAAPHALAATPHALAPLALASLALAPACAAGDDGDGGDDDDDDDDDDDTGEGEGEGEGGEGEGGEGEGEGEGGEGEGEPNDPAADALRAMNAEVRPRVLVEEQLELCVQLVFAATELVPDATQLVVSGTVDLSGATPSYSELPANALVLREPGGVETRYVVSALSFDPDSLTVDELFLRDHDVACDALRAGAFDLALTSASQNDDGVRTADGTFTEDGEVFTVALDEATSVVADIDAALTRYDAVTTRETTVTGAGLAITGTATDTYVLVLTDSAFENRTTATSFAGTIDGVAWSLDGGLVRRSFLDAFAAEPDFWAETGGVIERAGAPFAALGFRITPAELYEIVLVFDGGDVEVLEAYQ